MAPDWRTISADGRAAYLPSSSIHTMHLFIEIFITDRRREIMEGEGEGDLLVVLCGVRYVRTPFLATTAKLRRSTGSLTPPAGSSSFTNLSRNLIDEYLRSISRRLVPV